MSGYEEVAVFRTSLDLTEQGIIRIINETYYQNPLRIVMLPIVSVEIFPEEGPDRIFALGFGYTELPSILQQYGEILEIHVRRTATIAAELATGETEAELLLTLVNVLMEAINFDDGAARTISTHGSQNLAATAVGALFRGRAVGEGFAMALKAVADELGFDCRVVLGYYDGSVHAWNIISLYGDFYHVDVAMSVLSGIETAFLKTDTDFEEMYSWDRANTVICNGELTLDDILGTTNLGGQGNNEEQNGEQNGEED